MFINFAMLPLTIDYLDKEKNGVWLAISSILGWINFMDIGLGHGLRNKLAEALAKGETSRAKTYVSTAYTSITILCFGIFLIFLIINHFINWCSFLNIKTFDEDLNMIALVVFSMFSLQFALQLINSIMLSTQQSARVSLFNMIANLLVLVATFFIVRYARQSLFLLAFIFSVIPVIVFLVVNIFYFKTKFRDFAPNFRYFDREALKDVLHLGVKFFIIQISVLVLYQTSNVLICRYLTCDLVTPYNIAYRYFSIITISFSMIVAPYWSAYTEAYVKKDFKWIKKTLRQSLRMWVLFVFAAILMLLVSDKVYHYWIYKKNITVDFNISFFMMLYVLIITFGSVFMMFLNGIGEIKMQMKVNIISMVLFFPLSYILTVILDWGISGIMVSIILCSFYGPLVAPFQVRKVLTRLKREAGEVS